MSSILTGRFVKCSQEEKIIKGTEGNADSKYYVVYLSNGVKTFDVTAGEKNPIINIPCMEWFDMGFDVVDRKVKVVEVSAIRRTDK